MRRYILGNWKEIVLTGMVGHDKFAVQIVTEEGVHPVPVVIKCAAFWSLDPMEVG